MLKTRGAVSCSLHNTKPLLAKAGNRLGEKFDLLTDEVAAFRKLVRDRTYETRIKRQSLIALRAQHLTDGDLVPDIREVRSSIWIMISNENPSTHTTTKHS